MSHLSLYTIPAGQPFVDVLARKLLSQAGDDPMALARMRILLPSRRAAKSLREAFLRQSGGKALLLPIMQPIGDVDAEELALTALFAKGALPDALVKPVMASSRRMLLLAMLVSRFQITGQGPSVRMEQAVKLGQKLAEFLDEVLRLYTSDDADDHLSVRHASCI